MMLYVANGVILTVDNNGQPCLKRAFNTQACEQLNAWLGGFESILKCMVPGNFDWFLYTMLFFTQIHTRYVLKKRDKKRENAINEDEGESDRDDGDKFDIDT